MNIDQRPEDMRKSKDIDQYTRFFEPTVAEGKRKETNRIKPLIGKETRVANIIRSDMNGYLYSSEAIMEMHQEGQLGLAFFIMIQDQRELNLTDSFGGETRDEIFTHKFEYTQKQDITEHVEQPKRKGFFGR
jgi:hypothetical protein